MAEGSGNASERGNEDSEPRVTLDDQVEFFAKKLVLNAHDVKQTYKDQPESLRAYFNAPAEAEGAAKVSTLVCGMIAGPLAVFAPWTLFASLPLSLALIYAGCATASKT